MWKYSSGSSLDYYFRIFFLFRNQLYLIKKSIGFLFHQSSAISFKEVDDLQNS